MSAPLTPFTAVRERALRLQDRDSDFDALLDQVGNRAFVMLGEASHGTKEFYNLRARITRRLISEYDFQAVAVEADWPDAYQLNRHVRGLNLPDREKAFAAFERFPEWMWRNHEVDAFIAWLQAHNRALPEQRQAGFYGLDLYSLFRSADEVLAFIARTAPDQLPAARRHYDCLDHDRDPQRYGYEAALQLRPDCREAAARQLLALRGLPSPDRDGPMAADDERFVAERNAVLVRNAEAYYRAMFGPRQHSWNLRDAHMVETLLALHRHLREGGGSGRIVVWAHNSHIGDARATGMGKGGEWNLGQLTRQYVGEAGVLLVGFTTYTGTVSAAHEWGGRIERMRVRPALEDSVERLFERTRLDRFYLPLHGAGSEPLHESMLERAIGVIYRPETERASHYFETSLAAQFDGVFHLDETEAVEPLYEASHWYEHLHWPSKPEEDL